MGTIKLYKKYKRLNEGGVPPNQQFSQGVGYGNTALQVANIGNQMFGDQGNEFGVKDDFASTAGGALSGAASGAAMGSMLGPWGTLGGAAIGGVAGAIKAGKTNKEAKERQALYEQQRKQLAIQNSQNQWQQILNNGFQVQGNMNAQKYAKNGGLLYKKMGDGGKANPAKVYTNKAEFLKAKEAYGDSLDLYNLSEKQRQLTSGTNNIKFDSKLFRNDYYKQENEEFKTRKETGDFVKRKVDIDLENTNKNPRIYISNRASGDIYHKDIKPTSMYYEKIDEEGKKYSDKSLWEDFKDVALGKNVSNLGAVNVSYKKPNQPVEFKETVLNKPATNSVSKSKTQVTQKATINPVVERMSEMTPVETIEPQVEDTLIKKDINMKPIYTSKSRVWNTFTPPTKKVERAPGLGGFNTIMKNGGNVQQLSKTNVQFNGNSHENGGIKEPLVNGVRLDGTEVEGNESMSTSNGQKFVFSENLGFAQQHKPLAKAMGKIEKYLKSNPNDPIRKRTLNTLKEREEQLKVKQEETKEVLGLENNLGEMKLGGAIKRKDGVYIDREGVMKYPLKNGGLYKAENGLPDYTFRNTRTAYADPNYTRVLADGTKTNQVGLDDGNRAYVNSSFPSKFNVTDPTVKGTEMNNTDNTSLMLPEGQVGTKMNWGNLAGKIIPYAGVASNYMLNEKARKMTTPKEALPDYVKYKPVDYSASKIEADQQRRQLNKSLTQNVTNSAVAAALKAKNLGTTIGAKNLINQEEMNVNTEGVNRINLINNQIQQKRNQIDVENRDRDYNKEQRYLTQKGEIVNNFSDIYQKQGRDQRLEGLENRKIDVLSKYDTGRGVHEREIIVPSILDKQSRGQSLSKQEQEFLNKNPDLFKRNGGIIKKTNKLYNKLKK